MITFYYLAALKCMSLIIPSYRGHKLKSFKIYTLRVHYLWLVLSFCLFLDLLYLLTGNIVVESKYHPANKCSNKKKNQKKQNQRLHYPKRHHITPLSLLQKCFPPATQKQKQEQGVRTGMSVLPLYVISSACISNFFLKEQGSLLCQPVSWGTILLQRISDAMSWFESDKRPITESAIYFSVVARIPGIAGRLVPWFCNWPMLFEYRTLHFNPTENKHKFLTMGRIHQIMCVYKSLMKQTG
jgi:hypothetical protein